MGNDEAEKNKSLPLAALEQTIFVGKVENPICYIKRKEIPDYLDEEFYRQFNIWYKWKRFGLPLSGTWLEHPKHIIDIIETIDEVINQIKNSK